MKSVLLSLLVLVTSSAFAAGSKAREVIQQIQIVKGPYMVPVVNSRFNVLGADFKAEGKMLAYMTGDTIDFSFSRSGGYSVKAIQDKQHPNYFYGGKKKGDVGIRLGFESDKLSWLYTSSDMWDVTITDKAQEDLVAETPFSKLSENALFVFVNKMIEEAKIGSVGDYKISSKGAKTIVTAEIHQFREDVEEGELVGKAIITFDESTRTITLKASIEDLK